MGVHRIPSEGSALLHRSRYDSVDWQDLWRRLRLYACVLIGGMNVVVDCGVSADDLVAETIEKFLNSPNGLGWRASKGSLPIYLGAVLKNLFLDHMRRDAKVRKPESDEDGVLPQIVTGQSPGEAAAVEDLRAKLLALVKGRDDEKELEELLLAGSMITGAGKVNQQLVDILNITVGEVINRRKRLWRVAGVGELYEEIKHGRQTKKVGNKGDRETLG